MDVTSKQVKQHFDRQAAQWDALYDETRFAHTLNLKLRNGMYARVALTLDALGDLRGKSVLDVGCGSGRISVLLAKRGANVVGIDFAENMIEKAVFHAKQNKVDKQIRFERMDFLN